MEPRPTLPPPGEELLQLLTRITVDGDVEALQNLFTLIVGVADDRDRGDILAAWGEDIG
jgi:hypothetical protein